MKPQYYYTYSLGDEAGPCRTVRVTATSEVAAEDLALAQLDEEAGETCVGLTHSNDPRTGAAYCEVQS